MGIGIQSLNLTLSLWKDGWFDNFESVVELGSQDMPAPEDELSLVFKELLKMPLPAHGTAYTPKLFYTGMGFKDYQCIDLDGRHNAHKFDLNKDLSSEYNYRKRFNLVMEPPSIALTSSRFSKIFTTSVLPAESCFMRCRFRDM